MMPADREAHLNISVAGEDITIEPVKVGQLAKFCRHLEPILDHIKPDADMLSPTALVELVAGAGDDWIEAISIATGLERDTLNAQPVDVLIDITAKVVEVNLDFLIVRVLPAFNAAAERISSQLSAKSEDGLSAYSAQDLN